MNIRSGVLIGAALGAPLLLRAPLPASIAVVVAVVLLCVLPGAALARALAPDDPLFAVLVTVTGSLAVTIAVSTVLLYLGVWSGPAAAACVGLVTVVLVLWGEGGRTRDLA
ncbi:MAG: hypothetical protein ACTHKG_02145 [Nocardioides sp.]